MKRAVLAPILLVLCLPLTAQVDNPLLHGEWERADQTEDTDIISLLRLDASGEAYVELDGQFSAAYLGASGDEDVQQLADVFPEGLRIQIVAEGTWSASTDSLNLDFPAPELLINGESFEDFILTIAASLAATVIDQLGLPPEQEPAVIATFAELLSEELTEEDVTSQAFADDGEPTAYRVEDNRLVLTDAAGTQSTWHRRTESAVLPGSWGQMKMRLRQGN